MHESKASGMLNFKSTNQYKEWKKKRKYTSIVYTLFYFLNGIERSANTATLWVYVTTLINTKEYDFAYGIINMGVYFAPILFSSIIARLVDNNKRIKLTMTLLSLVGIFGCMLYLIPWSLWFPFFGKFFNGFVLCIRPLIIGETARVFRSERLQNILPVYATVSAIGFATGPCLTAIFINVNIKISTITINYGNISGLILLVLSILVLICHVFISHDLSLEYNLKEHDNKSKPFKTKKEVDFAETTNEDETWYQVLYLLITTPELLILFFLTFYSSYLSVVLFRYLPILVITSMKLDKLVVNIWYVFHAIIAIFAFLFVIKSTISSKMIFRYVLFGIFDMTMVVLVLQIGEMTEYRNNVINIAGLVLFNIFYTAFELSENIFTIVVAAKLVSSNKQCFIESLRVVVKQCGSLIGAFSCAYLLGNITMFAIIVISATLLLSMGLVRYSKIYSSPDILI